MPPVSRPALARKATPTEISVTPTPMATASSVREWGTAAGAAAVREDMACVAGARLHHGAAAACLAVDQGGPQPGRRMLWKGELLALVG
ncbi:myosin heavy chain [Acidovorax sp. MR-S7]|nr:myosin heavy chain [Acidovorax sp. MR-S7]